MTKPSPIEVFRARSEARALLFYVGEIDLHEAVDILQAAAASSGLLNEIGQDAIQQVMAVAFKVVRS